MSKALVCEPECQKNVFTSSNLQRLIVEAKIVKSKCCICSLFDPYKEQVKIPFHKDMLQYSERQGKIPSPFCHMEPIYKGPQKRIWSCQMLQKILTQQREAKSSNVYSQHPNLHPKQSLVWYELEEYFPKKVLEIECIVIISITRL